MMSKKISFYVIFQVEFCYFDVDRVQIQAIHVILSFSNPSCTISDYLLFEKTFEGRCSKYKRCKIIVQSMNCLNSSPALYSGSCVHIEVSLASVYTVNLDSNSKSQDILCMT